MKSRRKVVLAFATAVAAVMALGGGNASGQDPTPTASPNGSPTTSPSPSPSGSAGPRQVLLAFTKPAPSDPARPCATGVTFKRNTYGDTDRLFVCTFDAAGNPYATDLDGTSLSWRIEPMQQGTLPMVEFNPEPPRETSSTAGAIAEVGIEALGGYGSIVVELLSPEGYVITQASVEKWVDGEPYPVDVEERLGAERAAGDIRGRLHTVARCRPDRTISLYRRGSRKWIVQQVGSTTTMTTGRWRIDVRRAGVYFLQAESAHVRDRRPLLHCLGDTTDDLRIRRRRPAGD